MIKPLQRLLLFISISLISNVAFCQTGAMPGDDGKTKADDDGASQHNIIKFGANYLSNIIFMGRTDTAKTPAVLPELKYTLSNGLFFSASASYIFQKKKNKIDGGDLSAGYNFDITDNLSGSASYTKLFYTAASTQIASSIGNTFNANLSYDTGTIISPSVSVDYDLNGKGISNDVFVDADVSHDFIYKGIFGDEDILLISPTITVNTGTQNFYDGYLTNVKKIKAGKTKKATNAVAQYTGTLSQFKLLDFELSAPLDYKSGHFLFQFTPTYAIVKNQLPAALAARLSNAPSVFYFEAGVFMKF
ncbi:hypothetical protein [Mucilaginibacter sp.]|uniref:hypothetical protein n=1 Tax=Mucilaginibacter sp. TaxID=1882438 RepID=UPI002843992A|nr:hypothetical protein [Mucilaginibacter sp.]MDR3694681.1 hypothetical protein [Mucilaginibacter sp.]